MKKVDVVWRWLIRLLELQRVRRRRLRRVLMGLAASFLVAGIIISLSQQTDILSNLKWQPALVVLLVAVPVTVCLNAVEFMLSGRMIGVKVSMLRSLEITILGTAANMLPLPGSTLVRVAGLKAAGAGIRASSASTLLIAAIWVGVAFVFSGTAMCTLAIYWPGSILFVIGTTVWGGSSVIAKRLIGFPYAMLFVSVVKVALVMTDILRIYLCFQALGVDASISQSGGFAIASVVGSAASIVPAGLGVREVVSAAMAPLIGLAAAQGFLATSLNRLVGLLAISPVAIALALANRDSNSDSCRRA